MRTRLGAVALAAVVAAGGCFFGGERWTGRMSREAEAYGVPPGGCRVWYPGAARDTQPPAGPCEMVMRYAPANAWLLYRPDAGPRILRFR
jgi:hypothetical protein